MKKRILAICLSAAMAAAMIGCSSKEASNNSSTTQQTEAKPISLVSREDGSGTRGAFIELFGIEQKNDAGEKVDYTSELAEITNSTSVMMATIAGNKNAIGYVSLGSLNDTVKAVNIDGAAPSVDTIKDGTYKISRPFNIATKAEVSDVTADFISFILSSSGQAVVEDNGYISASDGGEYVSNNLSGKITISGSSSVTPVMEKLKEAYLALNPDVTIELLQSDSTTGMNDAIDGTSDIGMASRELKDSEIEAGITSTVIAIDGIAVIVNNENEITDLTSEQVKNIFIGEITDWSEI